MRCDGCKHWDASADTGWESGGIDFGKCMAVRERWRIQDAASENMEYGATYIEKRKTALKASRAYVQDGSEYVAELLTGPDFFCALFQLKD